VPAPLIRLCEHIGRGQPAGNDGREAPRAWIWSIPETGIAEPRDRDRGVGGTAAIDDEKALRLGFSVRLWEAIDPEHLVEHDDPGAQDRAPGGTGANGTTSSSTLVLFSIG
jgi:hypothetical protein